MKRPKYAFIVAATKVLINPTGPPIQLLADGGKQISHNYSDGNTRNTCQKVKMVWHEDKSMNPKPILDIG